MPVEFDLYSGPSASPNVTARIKLMSDGRWEQLSRNGRRDSNFPNVGFWGKADGHGGTSMGSLLLGPESVRGSIAILTNFYPAQSQKTGSGYFQTVENWSYTGPVQFHIVSGEQVTSKSYATRLHEAYGAAYTKGKGKVPEQVLVLFQDPKNLLAMAAFGAAHLVRNPSLWFKILRTVAGRVLAYVLLAEYAYKLDKFYGMVESATTQDEIDAAGSYLADVLAQACVDIGIALVVEIIQFAGGKRGTPQMGEVIEVRHGNAIFEIRSWRSVLKEMNSRRDQLLRQSEMVADPNMKIALKEQAFNLAVQASYLKGFVLETCHHMEVVKKMAAAANEICAKVDKLAAAGHSKAMPQIRAYLKQLTRDAGIELTDAEAYDLARIFLETRKNGTLPKLSWDLHDIESALTSKLSGAIAFGMKNPLKPPKDWTIAQLEQAASGHNPHTQSPMTAEDFDTLFPGQRQNLLKIYGSEREVYKAAAESKGAIGAHGVVPHHSPKIFADFWEMGCDVAHALAQKRCYRPAALTLEKIADIINSELPAQKRAWVKLGYACLSTMDSGYVTNPRRVSAVTLQHYGQAALAKELGFSR